MTASLALDLLYAADPVPMARRVGIDPEPWQRRVLRSKAPKLILCCARQTGKTSVTALLALHTAMFTPNALVLVASHRLEGSQELLGKCRSWARVFGAVTMSENATELKFANGSRLVALPATTNSVRGYSAAAVVIVDEAAWIENDEEVLGALLPSLAADGRLVVLSTPNGRRGRFAEWWHAEGEPGDSWERIKIDAEASAQWSPERIAEAESVLGPWRAASELRCEFTSTGASVFPEEDITRALRPGMEVIF